MAASSFPAPSLDASILEAIRLALLSVGNPGHAVIDRLLAEGTATPLALSPQEALGVFAALIKIEWDHGRAAFADIPIRSLVAAWKVAIVPVLDPLHPVDGRP